MLKSKAILLSVAMFLGLPAVVNAQVGTQGSQSGQVGESGQISSDGQISGQTSNNGFVGGGSIGGDPRATNGQGNTGGQQGGFGGMGGFGMGGMGGFGMGGMGRGMMGMFGGQQQQQPGANLRFPFVVRFQVAPLIPEVTRQKAETRLTKLPALSRFNKVAVALADGKATLSGEVVSAKEKSLIERLVLLEPGITDVDNKLAIVDKK